MLLCHLKSVWKLQIHLAVDFTVGVVFLQVPSLSWTQNVKCLCSFPSSSHLQVRTTPWAWGQTLHRGEEFLGLTRWGRRMWRRPFYPLGNLHHSLSLMSVFCLSCPPPSFYTQSLARHLPCASKSSLATILPDIALNSFLAFWDFAFFPPPCLSN